MESKRLLLFIFCVDLLPFVCICLFCCLCLFAIDSNSRVFVCSRRSLSSFRCPHDSLCSSPGQHQQVDIVENGSGCGSDSDVPAQLSLNDSMVPLPPFPQTVDKVSLTVLTCGNTVSQTVGGGTFDDAIPPLLR